MLSVYIAETTWLHRLPASAKLAALALASIALVWATSLEVNLFVFFAAATGFLSMGPGGRRRLRGLLRGLGPLLVVLSAAQFCALVWAGAGPMSALRAAATTMTQLLGLIALADLVSVTTPLASMLDVFKFLLRPLAVLGMPTKRVALAVGLMIRMTSLLAQDWRRCAEAFAVRGRRRVGPLMFQVIIRRQMSRSNQIQDALHSRRMSSAEASPPADGIRARPS